MIVIVMVVIFIILGCLIWVEEICVLYVLKL